MIAVIRILILIPLLVLGLPAFAQDAETPPLAAVRDRAIWLVGFDHDPQPITAGTARDYWNLTWSPDGNFLAYFEVDQDWIMHLKLYDRSTGLTILVASDIQAPFPLEFAVDSSQLFFVNGALSYEAGPEYAMTFYTYDLVPNAVAEGTVEFDFGVGCGGGSPFPPDWRYTAETMGLGGFHLVMSVTPYGLVHSLDCGGSHTGLLNLHTGEDIDLGPLSRAAVSADRTKVAGIVDLAGTRQDERLVVVALATGDRIEIDTADTPDQVSWSASGSSTLFYSTRQRTDRMLSFDATGLQRITDMLGDTILANTWEVSIHRVDLESGSDTEIFRTDAFAIGRMTPTPDGQALIVSQIPNADDWLRAVAEGRITMSDPEQYDASVSLVPVHLLLLPVSGGPADLIGIDLSNAALNTASYSA